ncbi:hypothetical protein ABZU76_13840 [Amycolatopsis sp. NPDC005232]|uniref:hypothetical protein n=1 Tax=Amycolatopsis sp. NPDC005232 TaxID=3157027 RepID=UPI0033BBC183
MAAVDDLVELVQRAAAAEKNAMAAKWKGEDDVRRMIGKACAASEEQRREMHRDVDPARLSPEWARLRQTHVDAEPQEDRAEAVAYQTVTHETVTHEDAAQAERDGVAAVAIARMALTDAARAVLEARLARIRAGEDEPGAVAVDGHVPLHGSNAVSRHGPALAHGLAGEIRYVLTRKPRKSVKALGVAFGLGLLYLGYLRLFRWDQDQKWLPYLGLWTISYVMGGAVCVNAMSFDAMRVRAALDTGSRLWHLLVIKNLALVCIVAPVGFALSALLAWRAGEFSAFARACGLVVCFILLWLGVGNVLSIALPNRDEPLLKRRKTGTLKQFLIALGVASAVGYLVNFMLLWRVLAARALTERLGAVVLPAIAIVLSCVAIWVLLTVFAIALAQQPAVRRRLQRETADYRANAEAEAYAAEEGEAKPVSPAPS